jgi:hypothetical protein
MTDWEKDMLKALADKKNMNISEYVRWLIARESATLT